MQVKVLGRVDYLPTYQAMAAFTEARGADTPDELWICEHPPVFTQGLAGKADHVLDAGEIPVVSTNRGGQVTYHGPGQVVAYPLIDLQRAGYFVKEYVYRLEEAVIRTLGDFGVTGHRVRSAPGIYVRLDDPFGHARLPASRHSVPSLRPPPPSLRPPPPPLRHPPPPLRHPPLPLRHPPLPLRHPRAGGDPGHPAGAAGAEALDSRLRGNDGEGGNDEALGGEEDLFTGLGKIAALGIKVTRHRTYHGLALNVGMDLQPFERINPCGYAGLRTVDLSTIGVPVTWNDAAALLGQKLEALLAP